VDLRGPDYNTNAQVSDLERLVKQLSKRTSASELATARRKRPRTAKELAVEETPQLIAGYQEGGDATEAGGTVRHPPGDCRIDPAATGVEMRPKSLSPDQEVAERLYATVLSLKRVGERLRADGETDRKVLIRPDVRLRDQHGRSS
jgi:hypothetical protein